ncbi:MAG: ABC-F family ATP-binding cassette domain-containing protein, partial [Chloroflexota bacterium]
VWGKVRIRYLAQDPDLDPKLSVLQTVFQSDAKMMILLRRYEDAVRALQDDPNSEALQGQLLAVSEEMDQNDGWKGEAEAKTVLTYLGIDDYDQLVGTLSGGQRRRVALAGALLDPGDLLILDEPTNHIDADTVAWLEGYLQNLPVALLMVTHDRYFLENVANRIVELNRRELVSYPGSYSAYLEARAEREALLAVKEEKRQILLRRELAWLRRGAQARSTKQKARKQRAAELLDQKYDSDSNQVAMTLAGRRLGTRVLEVDGFSKGFDRKPLFKNLDFQLDQGDRVGIIGPNGAGKSTLLNALAGRIEPDSGAASWGTTVELGYFDQQSEELNDFLTATVVEYLEEFAPIIQTANGERVTAPQMLEWFLFPRNEQRSQIGSLSGGERRRLYLLRVLAMRPNVLFLDEPTNDLDVQTLTVLEEFLDHFKGSLVVVSHDRYFLDRNVDYIMPFADGVLGTRYPSPYRPIENEKMVEQGGEKKEEKQERRDKRKENRRENEKKNRLTYKEKKELEALEEGMPALEEKIAALESDINAVGGDYERLASLSTELEASNQTLEAAMERWMELSEKDGG